MPLRIEEAIDLHCHYGPDTIGGDFAPEHRHGGVPALDAAREAADNGYAAIVLKSHSFASVAVADTLEQAVPGLRVFSGICTDHPTGGLNVFAVEAALSLGAAIVWLPTVHSSVDFPKAPMAPRHHRLGQIPVIDDEGAPLPAVHEIVDLLRQTGGVLATGHISPDEHHAVVKAFAGEVPVVVTHAGEPRSNSYLTPQQCAELADLGAIVEITAMTCQTMFGAVGRTPEDTAELLQAVGPPRCTLSTDYGWSATSVPRPATGFHEFLEGLWQLGVPEADLVAMASTQPARLLRLA